MGACTSRHEVLKNAGEAPLPAPEIEEVEVIKEEVITDKQEDVSVPAAGDGDEDKRQSLGNLFKESGEEKGLSENTSEQVKREDVKPQEDDDAVETEKEVVLVTVGASEENKTGSAEAAISDEKKREENPVADETAVTKNAETLSEKAEEEKSDEEKPNEKSEAEERKTPASDEKKPLFKLWF
ncbi:hypothetical protein OROGR_018995 [Orobanche gracilis]